MSNTSPVLNLAIIDRLELLREQFAVVTIPPHVLAELRFEEDRPGSRSMLDAHKAGWLRVQPVARQPLVEVLLSGLDRGEAAAIALASETDADLLLMDERDGRRVARSMGIAVTGVLGVLAAAWRAGVLPSLEEAIADLRRRAGFRLAPNLVTEVLGQTKLPQ